MDVPPAHLAGMLAALGFGLGAEVIGLCWLAWRCSNRRLAQLTEDKFADMLVEMQKEMLSKVSEAVSRCVGIAEVMDATADRLITVRNRITTERARLENIEMGRKNGKQLQTPEQQYDSEIEKFLRDRGGSA